MTKASIIKISCITVSLKVYVRVELAYPEPRKREINQDFGHVFPSSNVQGKEIMNPKNIVKLVVRKAHLF
jgi:hypothetical protein